MTTWSRRYSLYLEELIIPQKLDAQRKEREAERARRGVPTPRLSSGVASSRWDQVPRTLGFMLGQLDFYRIRSTRT